VITVTSTKLHSCSTLANRHHCRQRAMFVDVVSNA
jgi:hypothetical protein